jgi:hypothetical protein
MWNMTSSTDPLVPIHHGYRISGLYAPHFDQSMAPSMFLATRQQARSRGGMRNAGGNHKKRPRFRRNSEMQAIGKNKIMSNEYSPSGSSRSPRRGDRRPRRGDRPPTSTRTETPKPVKKKSIIEKILGFFSKQPAVKPRQAEMAPTRSPARTQDRPSRSSERATGMRKPEIVEVTSARLYVGNLSFDAAESDLTELFSGVGTVQNVEIVMNRHTMKSKGFAFVQMQSVAEAKRAVEELHDKEYMGGRKLVVSGAKAVEERRSERNTRQAESQAECQTECQSEQ